LLAAAGISVYTPILLPMPTWDLNGQGWIPKNVAAPVVVLFVLLP
jgi:hypothetical protein